MKKPLSKILVFLTITFFLFTHSALAQEIDVTKDVEYLQSVMEFILDEYGGEVSEEELIDGALKGMFQNLDPYTTYFDPSEADTFLSSIEGNYIGIGIQFLTVEDLTIITKVFPGSPAEDTGVIAGDQIIAVDGKSVKGLSIDKIASMILGPEGTAVNLDIKREGQDEVIQIEVERAQIKINPVSYEIKGDIGYINIQVFNLNTDSFFAEALDKIDEQGINKIILDLRNNPGGEVEQAISVAKHFVPEGLITRLDFRSDEREDQEFFSDLKESKYKVVVLVNGMTASASEIVAGAIQDTKAGTLVGTQTYGKSRVQNLIPLLTPEAYEKYKKQLGVDVINGYELVKNYHIMPSDDEIAGWTKITTGEYFTPNGRRIDEVGLTPDIIIDNLENLDINNVQRLRKLFKPTLNAEGIEVYNAEKILRFLGYDINDPDMVLDQKTFNAIKKFQADSGLYSYGVLDFITQETLNNALDKKMLQIDKQYQTAVELLNE